MTTVDAQAPSAEGVLRYFIASAPNDSRCKWYFAFSEEQEMMRRREALAEGLVPRETKFVPKDDTIWHLLDSLRKP